MPWGVDCGSLSPPACVDYAAFSRPTHLATGLYKPLLYRGITMSKRSNQDVKQLRTIGHKLKPVVTVAGKGLSDGVILEMERALSDHELIKVKLAVGGKEAKQAVIAELCERTGAEVVQSIGNVILVLRRSKMPDPVKSNLIRPL